MAHAPQHPHNPCSLGENERIPAKIGKLIKRLPRIRSLGIEICGDLPGFYQLQEILGKEFDV
jgi:hypothetical protein